MTTMRELRDFLLEAELEHYYSALRNELKVASIPQLKYVIEDDLLGIGMTKPEMRRLKKFYKKEIPTGKLEKFKRAFLMKSSPESSNRTLSPSSADHRISRPISYIRPTGKQIISSDSIEVNRTLGEGAFGIVQQGLWQTENGEKVEVAIKCLSRDRLENGTQEFLKEAGLMQTIDHENIVRMYGVVLDKDNTLMLVTELAPMRSLLECLKDTSLRSDFPLPRLCDFAQQISDGMTYLESKRLIHRDLAARNILVFNKAQVKISDFGLSRALGRGKDYYQSNFSINLKLPIAWCAPECINYLKFTSASDIWAYGVTLWELFTYGFQPWAGMSGQKILDAIDSPHYQRLDMPELCPKQYYELMLQCWDHEADARPTFSDIHTRLPQMRPTQVKAVKDFPEITVPKDYIYYQSYDIIIVIDKSPMNPPTKGLWRGVTTSGKCGYFDPYNMVPFVEPVTLPMSPATKKPTGISRKDSKRSASKRISTDMISRPQNDLRHTGHIGYDGAVFGDVGFIGDNYDKLPVKVGSGSQGKLDDSKNSINLSHISDSPDSGRRLPHSLTDSPLHESPHTANGYGRSWISVESLEPSHMMRTDEQEDHTDTGYQDIDDDSLLSDFKMPDLSGSFDFGGSFMDEVLKALSEKESQINSPPTDKASSTGSREDVFRSSYDRSPSVSPPKDVRSPPPPLPTQPPRAAPRQITSQKESHKEYKSEMRRQAKVKPMSASDEKMIDDAINMANEFAAQSQAQLLRQESLSSEVAQSDSDSGSDSPRLISKLKASIKGRSPKQERKRTFSDSLNFERESSEDVPREAQEAYNMLVVQGSMNDGSRQYQRQGAGDMATNRESVSSHGSVGHNFAYADSSSSISRTPDSRISPPKSVSRSSSERVSISPANLARLDSSDRQFESKPVPLPRPETSVKRSEIPVPRPRPEILRVEPTPRPAPPAPPETRSNTSSLIEDTSNNAFDSSIDIGEKDWQRSEESLKSDRNCEVDVLRVDLPDEKDSASKSSLSLDSGGKSTPSNESADSKSKFFGDDFDEPSPREIMSKLARESRLRRSVDHQRGITGDSEASANKNLREPQGIPGKLTVSVGDEEEVDTNPLRMLRGGVIPVRGGRSASGRKMVRK